MTDATLDDIRDALRAVCDKAGGVDVWCNRNRVWPGNVVPFLDGKCEPHRSILGVLGYQSRTSYVRTKP